MVVAESWRGVVEKLVTPGLGLGSWLDWWIGPMMAEPGPEYRGGNKAPQEKKNFFILFKAVQLLKSAEARWPELSS